MKILSIFSSKGLNFIKHSKQNFSKLILFYEHKYKRSKRLSSIKMLSTFSMEKYFRKNYFTIFHYTYSSVHIKNKSLCVYMMCVGRKEVEKDVKKVQVFSPSNKMLEEKKFMLTRKILVTTICSCL